jgi:hypothetical protein
MKFRNPFQRKPIMQTSGSFGLDLARLTPEQRQILRTEKPTGQRLFELLRQWGIEIDPDQNAS